MNNPYISVISPVYQAEVIVDELVSQISTSVKKITDNYEIILVEDGGKDFSWKKIEENCERFDFVKGVKLSKNFGQHYAVTAGIELAKGEYIILLDCDLQDDPQSILSIHEKLVEGNEVVFTYRKDRGDTYVKKLSSNLYKFILRIIGDKKYNINTGSMLGASKKACEAFLMLREKDRLYVQVFKWIGFRHYYLEVPHNSRYSGDSSYTLYKMISLGMQGITSHSNKLLKLSIYIGFSFALLAFLSCIVIFVLYFTVGFSPGWPSLFVALAFATGLILLSNGVLGIYIGKTFEQSKERPLYLVDQKINFKLQENN